MQPETNTTEAAMLGSFLRFLHREVFQSLGYLYALRDGNLLGAVRHGGLIPGDNDLDAIVLLPLDSDGGEDDGGELLSSALTSSVMPCKRDSTNWAGRSVLR